MRELDDDKISIKKISNPKSFPWNRGPQPSTTPKQFLSRTKVQNFERKKKKETRNGSAAPFIHKMFVVFVVVCVIVSAALVVVMLTIFAFPFGV